MLKKKFVTYLLVALMLLSSSIGYAGGYGNNTIRLNTNNNQYNTRVYRITYNGGNYNINQNSLWNTIIYRYNTNTNVITPVKPQPTKPVTPAEPTQPTAPVNPVEPTKPAEPTKPVEPKPVEPTKPVNPETPAQDYSGLSQDEAEVVRLVNIERQKAGLAPLKASSQLSNVARMKSKDMADRNYFSHTSPTYGSPFDMMKQFGISYRTAGENIAKGYLSPASVMNGWMNSSGHRANILNSSFGTIGVGAYKVGSTIYWTQMFTN